MDDERRIAFPRSGHEGQDRLDNQTGPSPSLPCSCPLVLYHCQMVKSGSRLNLVGGPALVLLSPCKDILFLPSSPVCSRRSAFLSQAS